MQKRATAVQRDLSGQAAIVTGAGRGIGFEIGRSLARHGCSVLLNDIDPELAAGAAAAITAEGGSCLPFAADVADTGSHRRMVRQAVESFGHLSMVVAGAGVTLFGDFFTYSPADFQRVVDVNLKGTFFLVQAAAERMRSQGSGGSMVLLSSVTGHQAHRRLAAYGMTKAALEMMAKSLVIDLSPFGITINAVAPGATLTERTTKEEPAYEKAWSQITPMGRPAVPADIAEAVLFLLRAPHVTGQTLVVDGGWTAVSPQPGLDE
jgi:3-oxoacyl-[acyl-carrier protein] reductase